MQTFLPDPSFCNSATYLDSKRLNKQKVEASQILDMLITYDKFNVAWQQWANHPAVLMWRGYTASLAHYGLVICRECNNRNIADNAELEKKFTTVLNTLCPDTLCPDVPPWIGDERFHLSHQSNLIRKDSFYSIFWSNVPNNLPYYWPTKENYPLLGGKCYHEDKVSEWIETGDMK